MDALDLSLEVREKFKLTLVTCRTPLDKIISRMKAQTWYTDDPVYQCLIAAQASLHAAINHIGGLPDTVRPPMAPPDYSAGEQRPISYGRQ